MKPAEARLIVEIIRARVAALKSPAGELCHWLTRRTRHDSRFGEQFGFEIEDWIADIRCLDANTEEIKDAKKYLLTALELAVQASQDKVDHKNLHELRERQQEWETLAKDCEICGEIFCDLFEAQYSPGHSKPGDKPNMPGVAASPAGFHEPPYVCQIGITEKLWIKMVAATEVELDNPDAVIRLDGFVYHLDYFKTPLIHSPSPLRCVYRTKCVLQPHLRRIWTYDHGWRQPSNYQEVFRWVVDRLEEAIQQGTVHPEAMLLTPALDQSDEKQYAECVATFCQKFAARSDRPPFFGIDDESVAKFEQPPELPPPIWERDNDEEPDD